MVVYKVLKSKAEIDIAASFDGDFIQLCDNWDKKLQNPEFLTA